jgi:hypothetical protein
MYDAFVRTIVSFAEAQVPNRRGEARGHDEKTIRSVEAQLGCRLPEALRAFAGQAGADTAMMELDLGFKDLLTDEMRDAGALVRRIVSTHRVDSPCPAVCAPRCRRANANTLGFSAGAAPSAGRRG